VSRPTTGEPRYRERVGDGNTGFTASMVGGDGKLYATSEEGTVHVVKAGTSFQVLAKNELGETCMATPAISDGVLYWRTRSNLVAIRSE
jgi:outer membrane protein assembly factor BamB